MNSGEIICVIPARGGSKGITGKNIVEFDGKPLLHWSIAAAKGSGRVARVFVSTDDERIMEVAKQSGAEVPFIRPAQLAGDDVHSVHVVLHVLEWLEQQRQSEPAGIMMLLPTSPLRTADDVAAAADLFLVRGAEALVSVSDLGKYMTNLRYLRGESLVPIAPEVDLNAQRQGLEKLYGVNGSIFIAKPTVLREKKTFHIDGAIGYVMDLFHSIDINTHDDFYLAERIRAIMMSAEWSERGLA
jgi:CMP-N,N'-diacetyllegionaminic acid synthase